LKHRIRLAAEEEERAFYAGKAGQEWLDALAPLGTDEDKPYLDTAPWHIVVFGQRRGGIEPGEAKTNYYVPRASASPAASCFRRCTWRASRP
jgi:hypothetical protein